jgi:hypothetical protein
LFYLDKQNVAYDAGGSSLATPGRSAAQGTLNSKTDIMVKPVQCPATAYSTGQKSYRFSTISETTPSDIFSNASLIFLDLQGILQMIGPGGCHSWQ